MKYGSPSDEHEGIERSTYEEQQQNNISESTYDGYDEYPWTKPSKFEPTPGQSESLDYSFERWRTEKTNTKRTVKDNMTLKTLGTWNKDPSNPRMFRIQDKGSRLVVEWKHRHKEGILKYLENIKYF